MFVAQSDNDKKTNPFLFTLPNANSLQSDCLCGWSGAFNLTKYNLNDLIGNRFGRLVIESAERVAPQSKIICKCKCDCGNVSYPAYDNLKSGVTQSCGCYRKEQGNGKGNLKHGLCELPEYNNYNNIKKRCYNKSDPNYLRYGVRGIKMCDGWINNFDVFMNDVGSKPTPQHSIDRIDNNGNYSCGHCDECIKNGWTANCKWSTKKEQARNRRSSRIIEYMGVKKCLAEWAEQIGLSQPTIISRLYQLNWSVERAFTEPKNTIVWNKKK